MTKFHLPPADLLNSVLEACLRAGASDADARLSVSEGVNVSVLDSKLDCGVSLASVRPMFRARI